MRIRAAAAAACSLVVVATGCSLFADFGGLSRDEVLVLVDGSAESSSSAGEGGPPAPPPRLEDGGGTGSDAAPTETDCATAAFCVDFEDPSSLTTSTWSFLTTPDRGSSLGLTSDRAKSPIRSLRVSVPEATAQSCVFAGGRREFAGTYKRLRTRFHVNPEGQVQPFALVAGTALTSRSYQLVLGIAQSAGQGFWYELQRADGNTITSLDYNTSNGTTAGVWNQIDVDWDIEVKRATITSGTASLIVALPSDAALVKPYVFFGAWCAPKPSTAYLDDLVVWTE